MAELAQRITLPAAPAPARKRQRPAILRSPLAVMGLALLLVFAFSAIGASLLAPYDPLKQLLSARVRPPSLEHWMGTDQLGRDLLSRMLFGAQISLTIGVVVVGGAGLFGTMIGLVAGYAGGWLDELLM